MIRNLSGLLGKRPEFVVIPIYLFIYCFCLTFQYVEGDDAYSVMYHALGRNPGIQRPYGTYQAMMDVVLRILPPDESIVRHAAIGLHAVFGIIFSMLLIMLIRTFLPLPGKSLLLFSLLLPFAVPELIFFGLYY